MKPSLSAVLARLRTGLLSATAAVAATALCLAQTGSPHLTAVRFWSLGDVTRVAIETEGEAQYHAECIESPDRLFVDLAGVRRQLGTRGIQTIPVGDRLVKQIRIAVPQPGVTRVVIDLNGPVDFSVSQLTYPDRIIVELRLPGQTPATPPVRSVTGGQSLAEPETAEPARTPEARSVTPPKPDAPAPGTETRNPSPAKPEPAAMLGPFTRGSESRKPEPIVTSAPARSTESRKPEPTAASKFEPVAANIPLTSAPESKNAIRSEPLKPATTTSVDVPSAKRDPAPIPDPPRIAPKKDKLDSRAPLETAQAAQRDSHGDRSLIRTLGLKLDRIVIDPGHGGHDTGTIGPSGYMEKTLVLDVARRLGALITARLGSEVIYTRSDDTFIPLEDRTRIANEQKADLFLSVHANSSRSPRIAGTETFYLNFTTSEDALEVAARENATSKTSIHELQTLVQKITLNEKVQESREFASIMQKTLYSGLPRNRALKNRGIKKAPFVVLIGAQMPSVLSEIAFLSNPRDEGLLKRADYRQRIAEALFKGVSQYVNALSHFQVARQPSSGSPAQ